MSVRFQFKLHHVVHRRGLVIDIDDTLADTTFACQQVATPMSTLLAQPTFLASVAPIASAQTALKTITKIIPVTCYLSSRLPDMQAVTEDWLKRHTFPPAPVVLRPEFVTQRDWKVVLLSEQLHETFGIIDDDLVLPQECTYKGYCISVIGDKKIKQPDPRVTYCTRWNEVEALVLQQAQI